LNKTEIQGEPAEVFEKPRQAHWKHDLIAAFSVAMVALPLCLGIAYAAGCPPISGIMAAIVGGLLTSFLRGGHISINGPGAGMIAVIIGALEALDDGSGNKFAYVLAAFVVSGAIMTIMGLFRLGKLGNLIPTSVIKGVLASIGIVIVAKQIHVALGVEVAAKNTLDILALVPSSVLKMNPMVAAISVSSLFILWVYPKIKVSLIKLVPAPMLVLIVALPMAYFFGFQGETYANYLIQMPDDLVSSLVFPNFSKIGTSEFWVSVLGITVIGTIITLAGAKAVDQLDPYKRSTNLDREIGAMGLSTIVCAFLGGLPVIVVIVRSTVAITNGGRTYWSNFFHGAMLLIIILLLSPIIQMVPLAALAAILIFVGLKLASPSAFRDSMRTGWEQFFIMSVTLVSILMTDMMKGLAIGIGMTVLIQLVRSHLPVKEFFASIWKPKLEILKRSDGANLLKIEGTSNFITLNKLKSVLDDMPEKDQIILDFSQCRLVDHSVMEYVNEFKKNYRKKGGQFGILGLDNHLTSTVYPYGLHVLPPVKSQTMNNRQQRLADYAKNKGYEYEMEVDWNAIGLQNFDFFLSRPIEYRNNLISGAYPEIEVTWEVCDITFDEGALIAKEVHHTTAQVVRLPFVIPVFVLEKEDFFKRMMDMADHEDIDFELHRNFSKKFSLRGPDRKNIRSFFTDRLINFLNETAVYHLESNGESLLIFKHTRSAQTDEIDDMVRFTRGLLLALGMKLNEPFSDPDIEQRLDPELAELT